MEQITTDPCLGPAGYITDEMQVGIQMFARYYLSHHHQDLVYERSIASLNKDIQHAGGDLPKLVQTVQDTLERYYMDAFDDVNVSVKTKFLNDDSSKVTLVLAVNFGTTTRNDLRYGIKTPFEQHKIIKYSDSGEYEIHKEGA